MAYADGRGEATRPGLAWTVPLAIYAAGMVLTFHGALWGPRSIGDNSDGGIALAILEHWVWVFTGQAADWRSPGWYWPAPHALGLSDSLFLVALPYSVARAAGAGWFLANDLTIASLGTAGFWGTVLLVRRLGASVAVGGAVAFVWSFGVVPVFKLGHLQTYTMQLAPGRLGLMLVAAWRGAPGWAAAAGLLYGLMFLTAAQTPWFLGLEAGLALLAGAALGRVEWQRGGAVGAAVHVGICGWDGAVRAAVSGLVRLGAGFLSGAFLLGATVGPAGRTTGGVNVVRSAALGGDRGRCGTAAGGSGAGADAGASGDRRRGAGADAAAGGGGGAVGGGAAGADAGGGLGLGRAVAGGVLVGAGRQRRADAVPDRTGGAVLPVPRAGARAGRRARAWRATAAGRLGGADRGADGRAGGDRLSERESASMTSWLDAARRPPFACEAFYLLPGGGTGPWHQYQSDAMLLSQKLGMPTVNGNSSFYPEGWGMSLTEWPEYRGRVLAWVDRHGVRAKVCGVDPRPGV